MTSRSLLTFGTSSLIWLAPIGLVAGAGIVAQAGTKDAATLARLAAQDAAKAGSLIDRKKGEAAVRYAESAVAHAPSNADYRQLLGRAYLTAGRFASAAQAFTDVLALNPGHSQAALNLALAQTALGDWTAARGTLDAHADSIAPVDRGLAMALAGDPMGAVTLLSAAARQPDADAKVRQNLALSLALAGRWVEARAVASFDVHPRELDRRMLEWATFARPTAAADQVAALLGVTPVADQGQPVQLALVASPAALVAEAMSVDAAPSAPAVAEPVAAVAPSLAVDTGSQPLDAVASVDVAKPAVGGIVFGAYREIVQPLPVASRPAPARAAAPAPSPVASTVGASRAQPLRQLARGEYYVQLGAYENAAVARDAWGRMSRRNGYLARLTPRGMQVQASGTSFYRLSVGGFARTDAVALCRSVKQSGGRCFVREHAGDRVAGWSRGNDARG